jgi:hypothetical protein
MIVERFDDIFFSVVVTPHEGWVEYQVYHELEIEEDYDLDGEPSSFSCTINCGGCVELRDGTGEYTFIHFCNDDHIRLLSDILIECRKMTPKYLRSWHEESSYDEYWKSTDKAPWETWL